MVNHHFCAAEWESVAEVTGKVSLKSIRETLSEKQLQSQPYSACTIEYCNGDT